MQINNKFKKTNLNFFSDFYSRGRQRDKDIDVFEITSGRRLFSMIMIFRDLYAHEPNSSRKTVNS